MNIRTTVYYSLLLISLVACSSEETVILFSSDRNGNSDVFLMDLEGTITQQLTNSPYEEWGGVWISENEVSYLRQLEEEIVRIKLNLLTGEETVIPQPDHCLLDDKNAIYHPTTQLEAYTCQGEVHYVQNGASVPLTESLDGSANYPSWNRVEQTLIITSNHTGSNDIYTLDLTTKELMSLTDHPTNDERGDLSSNGLLLAYSTDRFEKGNQDIAVKNLETKTITRLTSSRGFDLIARWAGDNQTLLIGSNASGNWDIYAMDLESNQMRPLTTHEGFDGDPRPMVRKK